MFDRPQERTTRNTGRVDNRTENIVSEGSNKSLYVIIGVLGIILIVAGVVFIYNLGKNSGLNSTSKPYSNLESEITGSGNIVSSPMKIKEIPFQELVGEYTATINNETITVKVFLEGTNKRYSYSKNKRLTYMLSYFGATNDLNFYRPKEGLAEFRAFREGNTIVLRSPKVELRKIK